MRNDYYVDTQNVNTGGERFFAAAIIPAMGAILAWFVISNQFAVEDREIKTEKASKVGLEHYVRLTPNNIAALDNKLIFVVDVMAPQSPIVDPQLGLEIKAVKAVRKVECFQPTRPQARRGVAKKGLKSSSNSAVPNSQSANTQSANSQSTNSQSTNTQSANTLSVGAPPANSPWVPGQLAAGRLVPIKGRPGGAVGDTVLLAAQTEMSGLAVSPQLVATASTHMMLNPEEIEGSDSLKTVIRGPVEVGEQYIYFGSADAPRPGDVRVHYEVAPVGTYSVMALKKNDVLQPYKTNDGKVISFVRNGPVVPVEISDFVEEGHEFNIYTQRLVTIVIFFMALMMIVVPLKRISYMWPFLATVLDFVNPLMAVAISTFAVSSVVFCSWITFRADIAVAVFVFGCAFMILGAWVSRLLQAMRN